MMILQLLQELNTEKNSWKRKKGNTDLYSKIEQGIKEAAKRRTWKYVEEAADEDNAAI